ncbi:MAG TPA: efflux RND transporter periplasmic adaptor subunit [Candidatus Tumulicola sp.]|jgi:HlyD family secretion protein
MASRTIPALGGRARALGAIDPRWILAAVAAAIVFAAALAVAGAVRAHSAVQYVTTPVTQQTLAQNVTASGTVNPQNNISVGTQVSGTISAIYVDYNSKVKKGQILARLDPSTFQAQLDQAQASLAQTQAQAAQAQANAGGAASGVSVAGANAAAERAAATAARANVGKLQAALALAQKTESRDAALLGQGYVAQAAVDADRSSVAGATADLASAQAAVAQADAQTAAAAATTDQSGSTAQAQSAAAQAAEASIGSAQAMVTQDRLNLEHSVITSPVDGTVVARDVSVGQTVAASLQTPTLFAIAQDLGKMQVDINVAEPDIGNVKTGETVGFSVLAYPNRTFQGTVAQVRINPQTLNNVVTYDVVVRVDNGDGALLPGMTAHASIQVATQKNALVVPLAALQWNPHAAAAPSGTPASGGASPWGAVQGGAKTTGVVTIGSNGSVFVQRDGKLARVPVRVALVTATQAAVTPAAPAQLTAGDPVVVSASGSSQRTRSAASAPGLGGSPMRSNPMRGIH